ncbi:hypothetical protein GE300_01905 [Rhodobacteraceae bacterium 2CG4]|uniref:Phosphomannomutase n=1 Tax=Halovulum marinum TaxID=2662447 RepID=A0A6L5YWQ0_9RHOB|nr:hypothetical protein [Halovulum marinum]MSU88369.1 hypothetical protein [Halovulum marinum]
MFTIEHEFDASVITLVDDNATPGAEDVTITCFDDSVTLEQLDVQSGEVMRVVLTMAQVEDLRAALDLPEGAYVRRPAGG